LITGQRGAGVSTEEPINRSTVVAELSKIVLNSADGRVGLLSGVARIIRFNVGIVIVGIVVVGVIRIEIPRIISVIQTYPEGAVPAEPVAVEEMRVASVPIPMLGAILTSKDMMLSAKGRFIRGPWRCRA
jgi:hypothetical protein